MADTLSGVSYPSWWPEIVRAAETGQSLSADEEPKLHLVRRTPEPLFERGTEWLLICPFCETLARMGKKKPVCPKCHTVVQFENSKKSL